MGGYGSGRKRTHTCINDCLVIDLARLNKVRPLTLSGTYIIGEKHTTITNFVKSTEQEHRLQASFDKTKATLSLSYGTLAIHPDGSKQKQNHTHTINLASSPCNYGGSRYWFITPCCQRRVRTLYLNLKSREHAPQCRECLDLHYPSQLASYVEKHKTYERHLLANYGLTWARYRYEYELKEHHLDITLELYELRERSELTQQLHYIKLLASFETMMYRTHLQNLRSLKSDEDKQAYLEHMREQEQEHGLHWQNIIGSKRFAEAETAHSCPLT